MCVYYTFIVAMKVYKIIYSGIAFTADIIAFIRVM